MSVQKPVSGKKTHYPISNLFLNVLLYIVEAKKGCKKFFLNILSLAADLLKRNMLPKQRTSRFTGICIIFLFLLYNIDYGYSCNVGNVYPQSMFYI